MERRGVGQPLKPGGRGRGRKVLARMALSGVVLFAVVSWVGPDRVVDGLARLRPGAWLVALVAFLGLHALSALKWRFMLALAGARVGARNALTCHAAGLFANLFLPSLIGGDVVRAGLVLPEHEKKTALVVGSVVDRVADLCALLTIGALGLMTAPWVRERLTQTNAIVLVGGLVVAAVALGLLALRIAPLRRLPRKLARRIIEVRRVFSTLRGRPVRAALGWSACLAIQAGFVLVNAHVGESMGLDLPLGLWFLLWPLAKIAAMAPISFGGLGVREAAFSALVALAVDESLGPLAASQSLVWQSVLIVGGLACGAVWMASPKPHALGAAE